MKLTNDISVSNMAGSYQADDNYQPFSGIFDGDDHTLTINLSNQSRFAAPFKCVNGATIKNLRTAGTINGTGNADGKLLAGIIGVSFGNTTITGCTPPSLASSPARKAAASPSKAACSTAR